MAGDMTARLEQVVAAFDDWSATFGTFEPHGSTEASALDGPLEELLERLTGNYPFFHPRYIGQMLKPPHQAAVVGYLAAMLHNPNNHALDGGPPTSAMEKELVVELAAMFRLPADTLGHLTSSGTIANLEALFIARELHPGLAVAFSSEAHYTHARMCRVLGIEGVGLPVDALGRLDLDAVAEVVSSGRIGTIVVTAGTTGLGMVDPIEAVIAIARAHDVRVHVDAAYGGFFTTLAWADDERAELVPTVDLRAISSADSVVVDPHKHGLQPYGCGAVLLRDPSVGRFYVHDSPYTYFSSDELHLGEISLECSRSGAAAAALWLTRRVVPWTADGLGSMLAAGLRAARRFEELVTRSTHLRGYQRGDLDIVSYLPARATMGAIDVATARLFDAAMAAPAPIFTATYTVTAGQLAQRLESVVRDRTSARILRSVLMKPETETIVDELVARLDELAAPVAGGNA